MPSVESSAAALPKNNGGELGRAWPTPTPASPDAISIGHPAAALPQKQKRGSLSRPDQTQKRSGGRAGGSRGRLSARSWPARMVLRSRLDTMTPCPARRAGPSAPATRGALSPGRSTGKSPVLSQAKRVPVSLPSMSLRCARANRQCRPLRGGTLRATPTWGVEGHAPLVGTINRANQRSGFEGQGRSRGCVRKGFLNTGGRSRARSRTGLFVCAHNFQTARA